MNSPQDIGRLFEAYCDGVLTSADARLLARQIRENDACRAWFLEELRLAGTLAMIFDKTTDDMVVRAILEGCRAQSSSEEFTASVQGKALRIAEKQRQRSAWRYKVAPLAAAAGLLLALGIGLWLSRTSPETSVSYGVIARVESVRGTASGFSDATAARPWALRPGDEIREGMRIETGADGAVTLAWVAEATTVEVAGNSKLETRNSKLARLRQGRLAATVGPQPPDQPFAVETPHALATVLGTRFRLEVRGGAEGGESEQWKVNSESSPFDTGNLKLETGGSISDNQSTINNQKSKIHPSSTWLHVEGGLVRFLRLADQASVDVVAGEFAVAGASDADFALKTYPAGTEWVDGPVIFEDDFSEGLKHWEIGLLHKSSDGDFVLKSDLSPKEQALVSVRENAGRTAGSSALVLRHASPVGTVVLARLAHEIHARAYATEWDVQMSLHTSLSSHMIMAENSVSRSSPVTVADPLHIQNAAKEGRWMRARLEHRHRRDEEGNICKETKTFLDGLMFEHLWIYSEEYHHGFMLFEGGARISHFVVREMILTSDENRAMSTHEHMRRQNLQQEEQP